MIDDSASLLDTAEYDGVMDSMKAITQYCSVGFYTYDGGSKEYVMNKFDETCQGTVPLALWIIGQSNSFEDAIRRAVSLGADADTLGAIVGSIAEAIWDIPTEMKEKVMGYLLDDMKIVVIRFHDWINKIEKDGNSF